MAAARTAWLAAVLAVWLFLGLAAAWAQTADDLAKLQQQAGQLFAAGKYAEALAARRTVAAGVEKAERSRAGRPGEATADALNFLSWYALFARAPAEALGASERAHKLAPDSLVIDTNRAHALLLLGRTHLARALYLAHKGKRMSPGFDQTWEDGIVDDFDALRAAGIVHKAFPGITAELGVKSPELTAQIGATRNNVRELYGAGKYQEAAAAAERLGRVLNFS
jgi:hypothetical protein